MAFEPFKKKLVDNQFELVKGDSTVKIEKVKIDTSPLNSSLSINACLYRCYGLSWFPSTQIDGTGYPIGKAYSETLKLDKHFVNMRELDCNSTTKYCKMVENINFHFKEYMSSKASHEKSYDKFLSHLKLVGIKNPSHHITKEILNPAKYSFLEKDFWKYLKRFNSTNDDGSIEDGTIRQFVNLQGRRLGGVYNLFIRSSSNGLITREKCKEFGDMSYVSHLNDQALLGNGVDTRGFGLLIMSFESKIDIDKLFEKYNYKFPVTIPLQENEPLPKVDMYCKYFREGKYVDVKIYAFGKDI